MSPSASTAGPLAYQRHIFNFAASYTSGGLKRLHEYAQWFDRRGGAYFVIHPRCESVSREFPNNRYFTADQPRYTRLLTDTAYLAPIAAQIGQPDLYYAYGIPIYQRFGAVNWFHLSNVLPLGARGIPMAPLARLKQAYLGRRIRRNFRNADIISAESVTSLSRIAALPGQALIVSVNGSDDELASLRDPSTRDKTNTATTVGTYPYKAIRDAYQVFEMLRRNDASVRFVVIGGKDDIPQDILADSNVVATGTIPRADVIRHLRQAKHYISATLIENSYNAASEGVLCADDSYISDIGPHRELLAESPYERVTVPGVRQPMLHVERRSLSVSHLKTWDEVITDMLAAAQVALQRRSSRNGVT